MKTREIKYDSFKWNHYEDDDEKISWWAIKRVQIIIKFNKNETYIQALKSIQYAIEYMCKKSEMFKREREWNCEKWLHNEI